MNKNDKNFLKQLNMLILWWQKIIYYYLLVQFLFYLPNKIIICIIWGTFLIPFGLQNADITPWVQILPLFSCLFQSIFPFCFLPFLFVIFFSKYVCIQSHIIKMHSFSQISHILQLFHSALQVFKILYFNTEKWGISTDNEYIKFHHSSLFSLIMCCFFLKFDPVRTLSSILMTPVSQILFRCLPEFFLLNKKWK